MGMTPPDDAMMNDTEDVYGDVYGYWRCIWRSYTSAEKTAGVNRLGRPKTYFLCFWCKLMVSSELPWKSWAELFSGTFPRGKE